jgi:hypothetical protein
MNIYWSGQEYGPGAASYSCKVVFNRQLPENVINDPLKEQPGLFVRQPRTHADLDNLRRYGRLKK